MRHELLQLTHECVRSQTYDDIEWLVFDDSPEPCRALQDHAHERLRYWHQPTRITIGEKRNRLIEAATGEIIVHFDDDDYYAPDYIQTKVAALREQRADLLNLRGFFVYHGFSNRHAYWDLMFKQGLHFEMDGRSIRGLNLSPAEHGDWLAHNHFGYGFGWTYTRPVWSASPFPDLSWNEDGEFALAARRQFALEGVADTRGLCLHMIHPRNTSKCFPQYLLPEQLIGQFFGGPLVDRFRRQAA